MELDRQQIHLSLLSLVDERHDMQALFSLLDQAEQARALRFHFEHHRQRFIVSHAYLRTLLSSYLSIDPAAIVYSYQTHGKPQVNNTLGLHFNMSHSGDYALYAFAHHEIGVDIEALRESIDKGAIAQRFFSATEAAYLNSLQGEVQRQAFFRAWTRKEAWLKAQGSGLHYPLNQCEVSMDSDNSAALLSLAGDTSAAATWGLYPVAVPSGYLAAVAVATNKALRIDSATYVDNQQLCAINCI